MPLFIKPVHLWFNMNMTDNLAIAATQETISGKSSGWRTLLFFMIAWFVLNCLQAFFLGVDGDEAYYWMLSRDMDWGYFDHPPFVAALINLGESIGHGTLFTRLGTILVSTLTLGVMFAALPDRLQNVRNYLLVFSATLVLHVYGFITTPDAPLLFFSSVFFYGYKKYLQKETFATIIIMALAITGMFYSKYHGILPVGFVVLSNLKLLRKPGFWLMVAIVTALFIPHLLWQAGHDWATVKFHLIERGTKRYKIEYTTNYLLGQLLVWGPFISLVFYWNLRKVKKADKLVRAHLFNFLGVLIFFFLSSFKNNVQPHWTLVAATSYIVLFLWLIENGTEKFKRIFLKVAYANIVLIIIARILFLIPGSPFEKIRNYRAFFHAETWAHTIQQKAQGKPVIFTDSYMMPSLYLYYNPGEKTFGYSTLTYRKNHYNINEMDDAINDKSIWYYKEGEPVDSAIQIETTFKNGSLVPVDPFVSVGHLKIRALDFPKEIKAHSAFTVPLELSNTGPININNKNNLSIAYSYSPLSYVVNEGKEKIPLTLPQLPPGFKDTISFTLTAPAETGKNRVLFSIKNGILAGNFASDYYSFKVIP